MTEFELIARVLADIEELIDRTNDKENRSGRRIRLGDALRTAQAAIKEEIEA